MARPHQPEEDTSQGPDPRYLTKDPRRESWVLPAEDTEFPFNPKIAELSTQEDFDTWVAAYGSKDLFRFFRYALEYHDSQIEVHNELIEMIDDASRSVTQLEETVRKRNAIIAKQSAALLRLLEENEEDRPSKQNTPSISHKLKKSTKLPDPLIFEGKGQDLDSWLSRMRNKLLANSDHYPTDPLQIAYTESRVKGKAAKYITPRLRATALNRFRTAEEIFDYLTQVYGDPDRRHTAQRAYLKLYQGRRPFAEFWAEFQRLAAELDYNQISMIDDLRFKLNPSLQNALVHVPDPIDIYEFARTYQRVDQRLKDIQAVQARVERRNPTAAADKRTNTSQTNTAQVVLSTAAVKPPVSVTSFNSLPIRPTHSNPKKKTFLRTGSCFYCKQQRHKAANYPLKIKKQIHEINASKNGLPLP
jgi:hypothetical protein